MPGQSCRAFDPKSQAGPAMTLGQVLPTDLAMVEVGVVGGTGVKDKKEEFHRIVPGFLIRMLL
jgi:hypothetical protein